MNMSVYSGYYYCEICKSIPSIKLENSQNVKIFCPKCLVGYEIPLKNFIENINENGKKQKNNLTIKEENTLKNQNRKLYLCSECSNFNLNENKEEQEEANKIIKYYCFTCNKEICNQCKTVFHQFHLIKEINIEKFDEIINEENKENIKLFLDLQRNLKNQVNSLKKVLDERMEQNENIFKLYLSLFNFYSDFCSKNNIYNFYAQNNLLINDIQNIFTESNKAFESELVKKISEISVTQEQILKNKNKSDIINLIDNYKVSLNINEANHNFISAVYQTFEENEEVNIFNEEYKFDDSIIDPKIIINDFQSKNISQKNKIKFPDKGKYKIKILIKEPLKNMSLMFSGCSSLISVDFSYLNTSLVTDMSNLFFNCINLEKINFGKLKTSLVKDMSCMFYSCSKIKEIDISNLDTSNTENMTCMFNRCNNLTKLNLANINTKKVQSMKGMFSHCASLENLNLSSFLTDNVKNMKCMFFGCQNLVRLDLSGFNIKKGCDLTKIFGGCACLDLDQDIVRKPFDKVTNKIWRSKDFY